MKRPNLTIEDARAIARDSPSVDIVDVWLGATGSSQSRRVTTPGSGPSLSPSSGRRRTSLGSASSTLELGRFFTSNDVEHRRQIVVLGQTPYQSLFPNVDPIGKKVRIGRTSSPSSASSASARARAASIPAPTISW